MAPLPPTWQMRAASEKREGGMVRVSVFTSSLGPLTTKPLLVTEICQLVSCWCALVQWCECGRGLIIWF